MKRLIDLVKEYKINNNLEPIRVVTLPTGVKCFHYKNGSIKVK